MYKSELIWSGVPSQLWVKQKYFWVKYITPVNLVGAWMT